MAFVRVFTKMQISNATLSKQQAETASNASLLYEIMGFLLYPAYFLYFFTAVVLWLGVLLR